MKKIVILSYLILIGHYCNAQKITLSEMIEKTKCNSFTEFNGFIIQKGFSFLNIDTSKVEYIYKYGSDNLEDTLGDGYAYKTICMFSIAHAGENKGERGVLFQTKSKRNYLPFISELDKLNFKVVDEFPTQKYMGFVGWLTYYKSTLYPNIGLQIILRSDEKDSDGKIYTSYLIMAVRKNN